MNAHAQPPLVMVIDDDSDVRTTFAGLLQDEGYGVVTAENGAEAFDDLERGVRPDVILLDLMMPVMSGWEFWDRQQGSEFASIPIIVLTATGLTQGCLGEVTVLPKSLDASELFEAVHTACASH